MKRKILQLVNKILFEEWIIFFNYYPENTGMFFIDILMSATNWDLILGFHPHPSLLPSREKELLVVIARPRFLRSWQSHDSSFIMC
jgi:hypothetical protein